MAWKYEFAPGGIDFLSGRELGKEYRGDMFIGSASVRGGNLFRLPIDNNRKEIDPDDKRLRDRVADNIRKYDLDGERVAAVRHRLRRHAGRAREPGRLALRRVVVARHGLRDPPEVSPQRGRRRSVAGRA